MTSAGEDLPMLPDIFPKLLLSLFSPDGSFFMLGVCIPLLSPFKICSGGVNEKSESMTTTCRSAFARSSGVQMISGAEL